jgi:hypothetical protein
MQANMGTTTNIAVADFAFTVPNRPQIFIDVAGNDFIQTVTSGVTSTVPIRSRPLAAGITYDANLGLILPKNGGLTIEFDSIDQIIYSPDPDFVGVDTFSYSFKTRGSDTVAFSSVFSDEVLVTITVEPRPDFKIENKVSTEQAIALVNGPFNGLALRGIGASRPATSQAVGSGFFANFFSFLNLN